jgi:hypothetical protein
MDASAIKKSVIQYFTHKCYAVNAEVGVCKGGRLRADLLAVNMRGEVVIVEVKSSYADFKHDKKWYGYVDFCNRLFFAVSEETYAKVFDLIPKGIGIIIVDQYGKAAVKQKATSSVIDEETRLNLVIRLAFRNADFNRYKRRSRQ